MYYIMLYVCHGHAASCVFLLVTKTFSEELRVSIRVLFRRSPGASSHGDG